MDSNIIFDVLIVAVASYRIAYLVAYEDGPGDVCARLRAWAQRRYPPEETAPGVLADHWVVRGLHCALCVSFWVAALVVALMQIAPAIVLWLAAAGVALFIHRVLL